MKGEPVQTVSSVRPKVLNLKGITEIKSYFRFWANLNAELSTGIFLNCGNLLKLFDSQALNSPIPRDPSSPSIQNNNLLLKLLFFITIPIILYRLNTRAFFEVETKDLARFLNYSFKSNSVKRTISLESNMETLYSSKKGLPLFYTVNSSVPEWWKDWIISAILPSWGIPAVSIDKVSMLLRTKNKENLKNFFEFYMSGLPNGEWASWRYDFDLCFGRDEEQNSDISSSLNIQKNLLDNNLLSSAIIGFCKKLLFEVEDPSDKKNYESSICFSRRYPSQFRIYPQRYRHTDLYYQPVTDYTESLTDSWVKREYREIGKNLIQDFVEFYSWVYQCKNQWICKGYEDFESDTLRCIAGQKFVLSDRVATSKHSLIAQNVISDILYNFAIFNLSIKVESESAKRLYNEEMEDIGYRISSGKAYRGDEDLVVIKGNKNLNFPNNHITGSTKDSDQSFNRYTKSDPKKWDWINFLILIRLPANAQYLNLGLFLSPITSLIADGLKLLSETNIAESLAGTGLPAYRGVLESHSLKLFNILKSSNYTDLAKSPMDERFLFLFCKPKIQPLNTQHLVLSEDFKSSAINVDSFRFKNSSCFSSKYDKFIGYGSLSMKELIKKMLFRHKPIIYFSSITHPLSSILKRIGRAYLLQAYYQFGKLITEVMNQINSFVILPKSTPDTRLSYFVRETNPDILLGSYRVISKDSETENLKYYKRYILMDPAEYFSLLDVAMIQGTSNKIFVLLNWFDIFNSWNSIKGNTNVLWISRSIDVCKHNKFSTCLAHIWSVYKYFHPIPFERITGLKERSGIWVSNRNSYYLPKCTIGQDCYIWQKNLVNILFGEFTSQIDRFYSDMCGIINKIQHLELFSKSLTYQMEGIEAICGVNEPIKDRLLENIIVGEHFSLRYLVTGRVLDIILELFKSFLSDPVRLMNRSLSSREFYCSNRKLLESLKYRFDTELVVPFGYCAIPNNKTTLNFLNEENIPIKYFYNLICAGITNWTDHSNNFHVQNKIQLKHYFNGANKLLFLDYFQNLLLLSRFNLAKRFMSLIQMESYNFEELSIFPLQKITLNSSPIIKQIINFGMYEYCLPLMELNNGEVLTITNSSYKNKFYPKEPRDGAVNIQPEWNNSENPRLLGSDGCSTSKKDLFNNIMGMKNYSLSLSINSNKPWLRINLREKIRLYAYSENWLLVKKYTLWFFTSEWWKHVNNSFSETFPETLLNGFDRLGYKFFDSLKIRESSFIFRWLNLSAKSNVYTFNRPIINYGNSLSRETIGQDKNSLLLVGPITGHSIPCLILVTLISFLYVVSPQYLATLIGFHSISLWKRSEIIKCLKNYPWNFDMKRSTKDYTSLVRQKSVRISLINFFKRFLKQLTRLSLYDPFIKDISLRLSRKKNIDISREEKSFVVQYLVTNTVLSRYEVPINHDSDPLYDSINRSIGKQGFTHFQFLIKACQRCCFTYQNSQLNLLENTMLSALQHNLNPTRIPGQLHFLLNTPISLQSRSFKGKGILLIGPTETGRSYLIKNLAANYSFPLVRIPIKRFLFNKPDFRNTPAVLLSKKCLYRLNLTFELVKKLSPCIVWIQDIHNLNFDYTINELGVNSRSLLHSLLRHLSSRSINNYLGNNIIIAPTHVPTRVDPAFISPDRLDQLINIRMLNTYKRVKEFIAFLHIRGFHLEIDPARYEDFGSKTMGYSKRDLTILANETLLGSIIQEIPSVGIDTIESAFYRQSWTINNKSQSIMGYGILLYRIGRAITRNVLTKNNCLDFPLINNHLLRKRFYFISDWYLETSIVESTIKESTVLTHILGCLAGLAARDSWFTGGNKQEHSVLLASIAENDFQLACGILESLLEEFPRFNLRENELNPNISALLLFRPRIFSITVKKLISRKFCSSCKILNRSIGDNSFSFSANGFVDGVSNSLYRASRVWHISFLRGSTYEFVRVPSEPDPSYDSIIFQRNLDRFTQSHSVLARDGRSERIKGFVGYRRLLTDVREKHIKTPENRLKNNALHGFFVESGTDELSTQYKTQHYLSNQSNIFLGGRFVWDPTSSLSIEKNYPFLRDELFSGERTVRKLYIAYSTRRENHKSFPINKYRKHLLHNYYNLDSMIESFTDPWNELPRVDKRYFEYTRINHMIKSQLLTPQLFPIVYPYQAMFLEETQNTHDKFGFYDQRHRWIKVNRSSIRDSIVYTTLFEIYQYLLSVFSANKEALGRTISILQKNGFILSSEIENIFYD